jgi:ribosomal protein S18 acetylase RimI-like enzyme
VVFYLVATRIFGGWTPMDVGYSDEFATPFPFLPAIASGVLPAIDEETMFRLVGVSLLLGLTRRRWLALLVPGALWAFAHTSYVRDPYYMRGIEILIPAIFLYGLFFLRFDLTTTIVGHMTYNATLGALPMLRSGEPYFVFSGVLVFLFILSPVLPGVWRLLRTRFGQRGREPARPRIVQATTEDIPSLAALPIQWQDWETGFQLPERVTYCLKADEKVLGCAAGRLEDQTGWIETIYVRKELREKYWGSALVEAVCSALQSRGAQNFRFVAPPHNHRAQAFLNGLGWRPVEQVFERGSWPTFQTLLHEARDEEPPGDRREPEP